MREIESELKWKTQFIEKQSMLLGLIHGSMLGILNSPDEELRNKLNSLFQKTTQDIQKLYYDSPQLKIVPDSKLQ